MLEKKKDNNTLIFFILTFMILIGGMQINAWLNPAKKKVDPDPVKETAKTPPTKTKPPSLSARIAGDIGLLCQTQWPTPLVGAAALAGEYPQVAELVKKPLRSLCPMCRATSLNWVATTTST